MARPRKYHSDRPSTPAERVAELRARKATRATLTERTAEWTSRLFDHLENRERLLREAQAETATHNKEWFDLHQVIANIMDRPLSTKEFPLPDRFTSTGSRVAERWVVAAEDGDILNGHAKPRAIKLSDGQVLNGRVLDGTLIPACSPEEKERLVNCLIFIGVYNYLGPLCESWDELEAAIDHCVSLGIVTRPPDSEEARANIIAAVCALELKERGIAPIKYLLKLKIRPKK